VVFSVSVVPSFPRICTGDSCGFKLPVLKDRRVIEFVVLVVRGKKVSEGWQVKTDYSAFSFDELYH